MIILSFSTINMLYTASHNWINKQMGLKPEDRPYFKRGRAAHRIIQDHVSGVRLDDRLAHINYKFPIVETVDFDPKCKIFVPVDKNYAVRGYVDGHDPVNRRFLEIKTGVWSIGKYQNSFQRKIYSLGLPSYTESIMVTGEWDPNAWKMAPPKVYIVPSTPKDRQEAMDWIIGGINIIEKGDFSGGLDAGGVCTNPYCYYGVNCHFKHL